MFLTSQEESASSKKLKSHLNENDIIVNETGIDECYVFINTMLSKDVLELVSCCLDCNKRQNLNIL